MKCSFRVIGQYIINWLIVLDCMANTLLGGDPQETISSRLGKAAKDGNMLAYYACRFLAWFDEQHCRGAIDPHEGKRALWRW